MTRLAIWTVRDFIDCERRLLGLCEDLGDDDPARVGRLLQRRRAEHALNEQSVLEAIVVNVLVLELHGRIGVLSAPDAKKIQKDTALLLAGNGIRPGVSRLSFIYGRIVKAVAAAQVRKGDPMAGLRLLEVARHLTYRPDDDLAQDDGIESARMFLRAGHSGEAAQMAAASYAAAKNETQRAEIALLWAKALRLSGRMEEAEQHFRLICSVLPTHPDVRWEQTVRELAAAKSPQAIAGKIFRAKSESWELLLLTKLWLLTAKSRVAREASPKANSLRRRVGLDEEVFKRNKNLFNAVSRLEEGYDQQAPLFHRLQKISEVSSSRHLLPDVECEMLVLAASCRQAQHYGQHGLASAYAADYQALCLVLTKGRQRDLLGMGEAEADEQRFARPATGLRRAAGLAQLGAQTAIIATSSKLQRMVAAEGEKQRIKDAEAAALGEALVGYLGELKGGCMKVAQFFSMVDDLPEDLRMALSLLRQTAAPSPRLAVEAELKRAFGDPTAIFSDFDLEPTAVASIGQIHRARLKADGSDVAVKIQHPGIRDAVASDLRILSFLQPVLKRAMPAADVRGILRELGERVTEETDYRREAAVQESFRKLFADDATVVIPKVFHEASNDSVLTMEFVEGRSFDRFLSAATQAEKNTAGITIARMFTRALVRNGAFNCDPHPGNYLFMPDGRVAFLDFGCSKTWKPAFIDRFLVDTARAVLAQDFRSFQAIVAEVGYDSKSTKFDVKAHWDLVCAMHEPLVRPGPFKIDGKFLTAISELHVRSPNLKYASPPPDALMLLRVHFGVMHILAQLEVEADWHEMVRGTLGASKTPSKLTA